MGFGFGFSAFGAMFVLMFGVMLVLFIVTAVRGISTWSKNNHSPRLTVEATVVSKRQNTSVHHHNNAGDATGAHGIHTTPPPPITPPFRWPAVTGWSCTLAAGSTVCWPRVTLVS